MSNEGEYLEMVNDLRDQYLKMKHELSMEIALLKEKITHNEYDLGRRPPLVFTTTQFHSTRPVAEYGRYTNTLPVTKFYYCYKCSTNHPNQSVCYT